MVALSALLLSTGCRQLAGYASPDAIADVAAPDLGQDSQGMEGPPSIEASQPPDSTAAPDPACATGNLTIIKPDASSYTGDTTNGSRAFDQLRCHHVTEPNRQWSGPQSYLGFMATKEQWYRIEVQPQFEAFVYVFTSGCTQAAIEKDCQSQGATGDSSRVRIPRGRTQAMYYRAHQDGLVRIAIDSDDPAKGGPFTLLVEQIAAVTNTTCPQAAPVTIDSGSSFGDIGPTFTPNASGPPACAGELLAGPQVYYRFAAVAKTHYEIAVEAVAADGLNARLLSGSCPTASCAGYGSPIPTLGFGETGYVHLQPPSNANYTLAVDSPGEYAYGRFRYAVSTLTVGTHSTCAQAQPLATQPPTSGNTAWMTNELALTCQNEGRGGPQAYYLLQVVLDRVYAVTITPSFDALPYIFALASCSNVSAIQSDCESNGQTGLDFGKVPARSSKTLAFRPTAAGTYVIAIDSASIYQMGPFDLVVANYMTSNETLCAASPLTVDAGSPSSISGDTRGLANEFGNGLTCGGASPLGGPQAYYRFLVKAGINYRVTATAHFPNATLYLADIALPLCAKPLSIEANCSQLGQRLPLTQDKPGTITISRTVDTEVFVAVDSSGDAGPYDLHIAAQP